jgi:hypothetical protein
MDSSYKLWVPNIKYFQELLDRYVELGFCVQPLRDAYDVSFLAIKAILEKRRENEG